MPDISSTLDPFAVLDRDGRLLFCGEGFERLIGAGARGAALGSFAEDWLRPADGDAAIFRSAPAGPVDGTVAVTRTSALLRYRLEPMGGGAGGGVIFLGKDGPFSALDRVRSRAFHLSPGLSAISVLETGEHLDVNDSWLKATGYSRDEVIGRTAAELNVWEGGDAFRAEIAARLHDGGRVENMLARMRTKSGARLDIILSAERVEHRGRKLAFFASHDIGEVRRVQAELARLNQELETRVTARTADLVAKNTELADAKRRAEGANDAKSRFLSMISHELRTPLNAIINMSDLLLEMERSATDRRYLGAMATASKALLAIVEDILDISRIEAGHLSIVPVDTDIEEIVEEVIQSVAPLAHGKGLDLSVTIGRALPRTARIDPSRLRQILLNLVGNAVKYTPRGWVHLEADLIQRGADADLVFEVADTGSGINDEDFERIFERFSQVGDENARQAGGAGLGLSISQGLAGTMGGGISVTSKLGVGSSFRLTLPISAHGAPKPMPAVSSRIALLGPSTRSLQALAATLAGVGADIRTINRPEAPAAFPDPRIDCAITLLPATCTAAEAADWCRLAQSLCPRVILLAPVGKPPATGGLPLADGLDVQTHPISRADLVACVLDERRAAALPLLPDIAGARILVVDDTELNRLVVERSLASMGVVVLAAASGEEALQRLAAAPADLVLMDLRMPGLDGYQTAHRLRALDVPWATCPIVAVSAIITPDIVYRLRTAGIDGHLAKPFRPHELRAVVARYLLGGPPPEAAGADAPRVGTAVGTAVGAAAGGPVLDASFLADLTRYAGAGAIRLSIRNFLDRLAAYRDAIETAGSHSGRAEACHRLAGAAGALGLLELSGDCRDAELRLRTADAAVPPAADGIALGGSIERAETALRHYLATLPADA